MTHEEMCASWDAACRAVDRRPTPTPDRFYRPAPGADCGSWDRNIYRTLTATNQRYVNLVLAHGRVIWGEDARRHV